MCGPSNITTADSTMIRSRVLIPNTTTSFHFMVELFLYFYQLVMISMAILGNSIVLYASRKFNAIHLDTASVLLIQNLAITDIALILVAYVPKLVTLYHHTWLLGPVLCYVTAFSQFVPGAVEIMTLTCISWYRWYLARHPLNHAPKVLTTKALICLMWLAALVNPAVFVFANKSMAIFDVRTLACVTNVAMHHRLLVFVALFLFGIIPVAMTILLNLHTLWTVICVIPNTTSTNTTTRRYNRQALLTVNAICWVFVLSWAPYIVRAIMAAMGIKLPLWFYTLQYSLNILSLTLNPVIYSITNRRFRTFLLRRGDRLKAFLFRKACRLRIYILGAVYSTRNLLLRAQTPDS